MKVVSASSTDKALVQVDYIRRHDRVGDKFHRRWDQQSRYNEAAALHGQVMKGSKEQAPGTMRAS